MTAVALALYPTRPAEEAVPEVTVPVMVAPCANAARKAVALINASIFSIRCMAAP